MILNYLNHFSIYHRRQWTAGRRKPSRTGGTTLPGPARDSPDANQRPGGLQQSAEPSRPFPAWNAHCRTRERSIRHHWGPYDSNSEESGRRPMHSRSSGFLPRVKYHPGKILRRLHQTTVNAGPELNMQPGPPNTVPVLWYPDLLDGGRSSRVLRFPAPAAL